MFWGLRPAIKSKSMTSRKRCLGRFLFSTTFTALKRYFLSVLTEMGSSLYCLAWDPLAKRRFALIHDNPLKPLEYVGGCRIKHVGVQCSLPRHWWGSSISSNKTRRFRLAIFLLRQIEHLQVVRMLLPNVWNKIRIANFDILFSNWSTTARPHIFFFANNGILTEVKLARLLIIRRKCWTGVSTWHDWMDIMIHCDNSEIVYL